jgi:hypothetical protein
MDIDGKVAYSDLKQSRFAKNTPSILPNPVKDKLYITDVPEGAELTLLANDGKMLMKRATRQSREIVDMSGFANGLYILQLWDNASRLIVSFKVIKK